MPKILAVKAWRADYPDRVGGEYHSVIDEAFFQSAMELPAWTVYTSPVEPRMIKATPIYWDEDGNGEFSDDELRGVIAIDFLYPVVQFRHERLVMWGVTIGITILAIIVTAIAVSMLLRRVTRPLHQLVDATKAISSGDLSTEIAVQSEDEVGRLASSFNQMARDLRANIDEKDRYAGELAKLNVELEDKVRARTRELEATNRELQIANLKYFPLNLYAVNKEVNFVPQKSTALRLKETSVTDNHWSVR